MPAHPLRRPWLRRLLGGLLLTVVGVIAGVAASAIWPTTVTTRQYQATVRLSADPTRSSTIHSPTVFGDLDVVFDTPVPAPGIEASVQVRDTISGVLASSGLDMRSLQPSQAELDAALTRAAWIVAGKVALGIGLVLVIAWLVVTRHTASWWVTPVAGLVSLALVAGTMALTYQRSTFEAVRTTGLLSLVRASSGLLGDVEKRSQQATPYVRNMLALAAAVQQKYAPAEIADAGSLRIVAVSDIHGANQYPLLKSLVEQEKASAVIDTGDLVNFGSVREAQAAGLFAGIESLGVPYLFVRGNHDASSPTDDELTQKLRTLRNVVVLEPSAGREYTLATVGGLTVAGFGDPRWFGDGGEHTDQAQKPSIAAFARAVSALREGTATTTYTGDRSQPFDLLLGHEPSSLDSFASQARLRLNGHMHSQGASSGRIQLGTFSGGGVVSHYIESGDGSELAGEPYAFDILTFGTSCRLTSLDRYQFTNLVEGRPTYDTVQVVNGATLEGPVPAGRTCSAEQGVQTATFAAPASATPSETPTTTEASVTPSLPSGSPTPTTTEARVSPTR